MQNRTKMRKNTQNIHKSTREHIMMTRPGFLALAVMLALTVALALAGPNTRDMSSLLRCSQCKNHSPKQSHSPSQKTGTCHHVVWAPHFLTSKHKQKHKRTHNDDTSRVFGKGNIQTPPTIDGQVRQMWAPHFLT